ncbi:MAG: CDP-alcohol phosphatidyltransferase family protein, partial [Verrucomicrobiae bacterium]|nr:CDP-alcohol phosphatidyltransferase family protein [Verrucomicrobiae bacterium]
MTGDLLLSLVLVSVLTVLVTYAWVQYRHAPSPARVMKEGGTFLLGERLMSIAYKLITPLVDRLAEKNIHPKTITWLSLPLGAASGISAAVGFWSCAAFMLLLSGLCDMLDGALARIQLNASSSGAALDSVIDRYVEFFVFLGIALHFRNSTAVVVFIICALFGSMMVTYSSAKAEALQMQPPRGFMKRSERITYLITGFLVTPWFPLLGLTTKDAILIIIG